MPVDSKTDDSPSLCGICKDKLENHDTDHQKCGRCGEFKMTQDALLYEDLADLQVKLTGWVRDQNRNGLVPAIITSDVLDFLEGHPIPSFAERAERLLLEMVSREKQCGYPTILTDSNYEEYGDIGDIGATYSRNKQELILLARLLLDKGWMTYVKALTLNDSSGYKVDPKGYFAYDELARRPVASDKAFVAMSFHKELDCVYSKSIESAIAAVGYNAIRIDHEEHINKIDDEIIVKIKESKFIVVDCTNHRPSVYFEAGYAMGIGIPIIWTCQEDDMKDLHFDVRQYNCIPWKEENLGDFKTKLQNRIAATIGKKDSL